MTSFWSWYVTLLSLGTIAALVWLLLATRKGQRPDSTEETVGHSYDGIEEYDNPLPRWWFMLFVGTVVFALGYLALYPGLGNWKGLLPGSDAKGAYGFPNLTDDDWLWGGEPETIKTTILHGRQAAMPAWKDVIGEEGIRNVAGYVRSLSGRDTPEGISVDIEQGQKIFAANCVVCHGPEAKGVTAMGAPNLTDNVWLYGSSFAQIQQTLRYGRNGRMPAQEAILGHDKVHLLAAYVYSLSQQPEQ